MPESFTPFLPELKPQNNIPNFQAAGEWLQRGQEVLSMIADGLAEPSNFQGDIEVLSAIPDVWARPILFEMALYDRYHPLHRLITGEWRGFLALIAFKERLQLPVNVVQLAIPDNEAKCRDSHSLILCLSLPKKSLSQDTRWNDIYVVLYDNHPIGIMSPTTLVCTAVDYTNNIYANHVSWFDGKRLTDPVGYLSNDDKAAMLAWLDRLKEDLLKYVNTDRDMRNALSTELECFMADLRGSLSGDPTDLPVSGASMNIFTGIFRLLNKPIGRSESTLSDVLLEISKDKSPLIRWLLVEREIAQQWGRALKDVRVMEAFTLSQVELLVREPGRFPDYSIKQATDIFSEKLIVLKQAVPAMIDIKGLNVMKNNRGEPVVPLLPVKGELLNHLGAEVIARDFRFEQHREGICARLELRLSGGKAVLEKLYVWENIKTLDNIPILELWPYVLSPGWGDYYLYLKHVFTPEDGFKIRPIPTDGLIDTRSYPGLTEVFRLGRFPEAIEWTIDRTGCSGLILLRKPILRKPDPNLRWRVAVDFGTVNTSIFTTKEGTGDVHSFTFKSGYLYPITGSRDRRKPFLYKEFIPPLDEVVPFSSCYHIFAPENERNEPIMDGHIFFLSEETKPDFGTIESDLKWAELPEERIKLKSFFSEIIMRVMAEAAAEGVNHVEWRFAYPSAFSADDREKYIGWWNALLNGEEVKARTGIALEVSSPVTESIAAAKFFDMTYTGMVSIDIGGGTSDVSFWQENSLIYQTSVLFAGRDIFEPSLRSAEGRELLGKILKKVADAALLEQFKATRDDASQFTLFLSYLLRHHDQAIYKTIPNFTGSEQFKSLTNWLSLSLYGLLYYVALLLSGLIDRGQYKNGFTTIGLAGNGTKIFRWLLSGGENLKDSRIGKNLHVMIAQKAGLNVDESIMIISKEPKSEVVTGLLRDANELVIRADLPEENECVSGEYFIRRHSKHTSSEVITATDMSSGSIRVEDLVELKSFLTQYETAFQVKVPSINWPEVTARVNEVVAKKIGANKKNIRVEPLFFVGLKQILNTMASR